MYDPDDDDKPRRRPAPKKKGVPRRPVARRRDEDDDDYDEPKKKSSAGLMLLLVGGGVGVLVIFLAAAGVAAYIILNREPKVVADTAPKKDFVAQIQTPVETKKEAPPPPVATEKEKPKPAEPPPQPVVPVVPVAKAPEPKPKPAKLPVPDEVAQAKVEKELKEKYKDDYAKTKPEDRLILSAKFLQPGRENRTDPAAWFVILREARDLAIEAQRPRLVVEAITEIDKWFVINAHEMKLKALTTLRQSTNEAVVKAAGVTALSQVKLALADDNYDAALRLVTFADEAVRDAKPGENKDKPDDKTSADDKNKSENENKPKDALLKLIADRKAEVQGFQKDYEAVAAAKGKLKATPDDADANMAVGKHLCLFHGRWEEGLPMLLKGSDPLLKNVAQKDLALPTDIKGQVAVGDDWWNLGMFKSDRVKLNAHLRALYWYEPAETKATGETKARLTERMKNINERAAKHVPRLVPGSFYGRGIEDRILLLREGGGSMQTEEAVQRGLEWLAAHQAKNGGWGTDSFNAAGKCECDDKANDKHDIAGTAFGLLPFLGAGQIGLTSRYHVTVERGLLYLLSKQNPEKGNFSDSGYEHALATIAVCEAYGLTHDRQLKPRAEAAVTYIVRGQYADGSWGYTSGTKGDLSNTGWQFAALKTAYYAGLKVPEQTFRNVARFLDSVADPNGLGYGYNTPGAPRATSAVGFLCREYLGWTARRPELAKGMDQLAQNFVNPDAPAIYYLFYATQAMHHFGGKTWEGWNAKTTDLLLKLQDKGDIPGRSHQRGSFSPMGDDYAKQGGRLMFTSLALLTLEAYYTSVPLNGYGAAVLLE